MAVKRRGTIGGQVSKCYLAWVCFAVGCVCRGWRMLITTSVQGVRMDVCVNVFCAWLTSDYAAAVARFHAFSPCACNALVVSLLPIAM